MEAAPGTGTLKAGPAVHGDRMALPDTTDFTVWQVVLAGLAIALVLLVVGYVAAWAWQLRD